MLELNNPQAFLLQHNPFLKELYEIKFVCNIPGKKVVGIVWPMGDRRDGLRQCRGFWAHQPYRLWLAVNPFYERKEWPGSPLEKGMKTAESVVALFNVRHR